MRTEERLAELGITLPDTPQPGGNYVTARRCGQLLFLAGHTSTKTGREVRGKLGVDLTVEQGYAAARSVAIDLIATMKATLGDLDCVEEIVKLLALVNATPEFEKHPLVVNGASDLLVEVFGDRGRHARSAIGVASLPGRAALEIEAIVGVCDYAVRDGE